MDTIGSRIKKRRKELGLTQAELADRIPKVHDTDISAWEKGLKKPGTLALEKLGKGLEMDAGSLLTGNE